MSLEVVRASIETAGGKPKVSGRMEIADGRTHYFLSEKPGEPGSCYAILIKALLNNAGGAIYFIDDVVSLEGFPAKRVPASVLEAQPVQEHVLPGETSLNHQIYEGGDPAFNLVIKAPSILS